VEADGTGTAGMLWDREKDKKTARAKGILLLGGTILLSLVPGNLAGVVHRYRHFPNKPEQRALLATKGSSRFLNVML
jgi:hypothetical protein